jgi:hypothetical protein
VAQVRSLLSSEDHHVDLAANDFELILQANESSSPEVVRTLVGHLGLYPRKVLAGLASAWGLHGLQECLQDYAALPEVIGTHDMAGLRQILDRGRVDLCFNAFMAFSQALAVGDMPMLRVMVEGLQPAERKELVATAAIRGHSQLVQALLEMPAFRQGADPQLAACVEAARLLSSADAINAASDLARVVAAAEASGHAGLVAFVREQQAELAAFEAYAKARLAGPEAAPAAALLDEAIIGNQARHVRALVSSLGVDPTAGDNRALFLAARDGKLEMARALLTSPEVAGSAGLVARARAAKLHDLLVVLLGVPEVAARAGPLEPIFLEAVEGGHMGLFRLLLPKASPGVDGNEALRSAASAGHAEMVHALLRDPRVNPAVFGHLALASACYRGHYDVMRLLLADPRIDPAGDDNLALRFAAGHRDARAFRMLMARYTVRARVNYDAEIGRAEAAGSLEIAGILRSHRDQELNRITAMHR